MALLINHSTGFERASRSLIAAADISMGSYEPALFDVVKDSGGVSLSLFRSVLHPECGGERLPMLVYR